MGLQETKDIKLKHAEDTKPIKAKAYRLALWIKELEAEIEDLRQQLLRFLIKGSRCGTKVGRRNLRTALKKHSRLHITSPRLSNASLGSAGDLVSIVRWCMARSDLCRPSRCG